MVTHQTWIELLFIAGMIGKENIQCGRKRLGQIRMLSRSDGRRDRYRFLWHVPHLRTVQDRLTDHDRGHSGLQKWGTFQEGEIQSPTRSWQRRPNRWELASTVEE